MSPDFTPAPYEYAVPDALLRYHGPGATLVHQIFHDGRSRFVFTLVPPVWPTGRYSSPHRVEPHHTSYSRYSMASWYDRPFGPASDSQPQPLDDVVVMLPSAFQWVPEA